MEFICNSEVHSGYYGAKNTCGNWVHSIMDLHLSNLVTKHYAVRNSDTNTAQCEFPTYRFKGYQIQLITLSEATEVIHW